MRPPATLLASIREQSVDSDVRPVVSLEAFFDGNEDLGSIGCNLSPHPGVATFYSVLRAIRDRDDVQDVLVGITEDMGDEEWPFSDTVYILTRAGAHDVQRWAARLQPDSTDGENESPALPAHAPVLLPDHHVVTLWWD